VAEVDTGLQAGVFTVDIDVVMELADLLRVGAVMINSTSDFRIDAMPLRRVQGFRDRLRGCGK
jgi:acyl-CoA reductase-like NAD-dependent aldehyde dehydrogenase